MLSICETLEKSTLVETVPVGITLNIIEKDVNLTAVFNSEN